MKKTFSVSALSKLGVNTEGLLPDEIVERKQYINELSISQDEERTCVAKINTMALDSDQEVVMPEGCDLSRFKVNPIVVWSHDYSQPSIGKVTDLVIKSDCIEAKMQFAETDRANEVWSLIKGGFLKGNSVGFVTKKYVNAGTKEFKAYCEEKGLKVSKACKRIIQEWTLLENSIVNLGSNPEALMVAVSTKSLNLSSKMLKELGLDTDKEIDIDMAKLADMIADRLKPKEEVKVEPIVEPVKVEAVIVSEALEVVEEVKPVEFVIIEPVTLSEDIKNSLIAEAQEDYKKMLSGKVV